MKFPYILSQKQQEGTSMILYQPTLKNYGHITMMHEYASQTGVPLIISACGVIHTIRQNCPHCGSICNYNGSNKSSNITSRSIDAFFKKGQQYCKNCDKTIMVENEFIDAMICDSNQFIESNVISLREKCMSYPHISTHLLEVYGIPIDSETVRHICENRLNKLDDLAPEIITSGGFYGYDEQHIKLNGKSALRIVIIDYANSNVIYEQKHDTLTQEILAGILKSVFNDIIPKGFVFDMAPMYPRVFKDVFGNKIKLQHCIFHLNKMILKEYSECLKAGKKGKWSIVHYLNLYSLFNIFYNREQELNILKNFQKMLNACKESLIKIETIDDPESEILFPRKCKTTDDKIAYLVREYEKKLMTLFRKHLHDDKLRRKRNKETLVVRTKEDAKKQLENVIRVSNLYPKTIAARIQKIEDNFELFTGSDGEYLTNNIMEGFFGSTLKGPAKNGFHSDEALDIFFKFRRLRKGAIKMFEQFSIPSLAAVFGIITALTVI
jgi:hypothetical protein